MVWLNGSRIRRHFNHGNKVQKPTEYIRFSFRTLKFCLLGKSSRRTHDYCPILTPRHSPSHSESCLFLSVLFSGLSINFYCSKSFSVWVQPTVFLLLHPPSWAFFSSFYFFLSFFFLVVVLSSWGWTDGRERLMEKKGICFHFYVRWMKKKKVFKGSFTKTPPSHTTCFLFPLT